MAVDTEYISGKNYNSKFKNYLRDFYVYQFKNKSLDFYNTGSFSRSRLVAVVIASVSEGSVRLEDFFDVKMKHIKIQEDVVAVDIRDKSTESSKEQTFKTVIYKKPFSEIFKYLYTADNTAFFITGNRAKIEAAGKERLKSEAEIFRKKCPSPRSDEKMYRYWGDIYLAEADETITTSTYGNDSSRLQTLVKKMETVAKIKWSYGSKVDHEKECLSEDKDDCVECVTADTREMSRNPFHLLYRYCNRYNNSGKDYFRVFVALILYFNLGNKIKLNSCDIPSKSRMDDFDTDMKNEAAKLYISEKKWEKLTSKQKENKKRWDFLTPKQKERYAPQVPAIFINDCFKTIVDLVCFHLKEKRTNIYDEKSKKAIDNYKKKNKRAYANKCEEAGRDLIWEDIITWEDIKEDAFTLALVKEKNQSASSGKFIDVFWYMIANRKEVVYDGDKYILRDAEYVEKKILYLALIDFLECGEKQFSNIIREFVKIGVLSESKEIEIYCQRNIDENKFVQKIGTLLKSYKDYDIELLGKRGSTSYALRYNNDIDNSIIDSLMNKLMDDEYTAIIKKCKDTDKLYYSLSKHNLIDTLNNNEDLISRFSEMVSFFAQTALLGEVGDFVLDRLPEPVWKLYFKHNYIVRSLNDFNNISLLYAMQNPSIKNHYWIEIESRDALNEYGYQHFVCYPLELRENVSDGGKQYLIYYQPEYRSIASIRVDFIDNITIGNRKNVASYFKDDIDRARELIKYTWGLNFNEFYEGNVKVNPKPSVVTFTIQFDTENEKFIRDRVKREIEDFTEISKDSDKTLIEIVVRVVNPWDMLHWIKTYTTRIIDIRIEFESFMGDVERANEMYIQPTKERVSVALGRRNSKLLSATDVSFTPINSISDNLFNDFYCDSFKKYGEKIFKVISGEKADSLFSSFSIVEGVNLKCIYDVIPLTAIEIQWLRNILNNKLARGFLNKDEIENIEKRLPEMKWFDVFDSETVKLSERHSEASVEEYYDKVLPRTADISNETCFEIADYGIIIRKMMQAIQKRKVVVVTYCSQYGRTTDYTFVPYCIEYSKRDNRFRVKAVCQIEDEKTKKLIFWGVRTFSVDLISAYKETGEVVPEGIINKNVNIYKGLYPDGTKIPVKKRNKRNRGGTREVVVRFADCAGIPDKILTEFSCYEKKCVRLGSGRYSMTLTYYEEDCNEIVIRLLGYGSLITVTSVDNSDPVVKELMERYNKQVALYKDRVGEKGEQDKGQDDADVAVIDNDENVIVDTSEKERDD